MFGLLLCCACGGASSPATNGPAAAAPAAAPPVASPTPRPVALPLRYSAMEGCPAVEGYLGAVEARATALELQPVNDAAELGAAGADERVDVSIERAPDASGWLGRVTIAGPRELDREVRGERCDDVVAALALITVLRLEGGDGREPASVAGAAGAAAASPGRGPAAAQAAAPAGADAAAPQAAPGAPAAAAGTGGDARGSPSTGSEPPPTERAPAAAEQAATPPSAMPAPPALAPELPAPSAPENAPRASSREEGPPATREEPPPASDEQGPFARGPRSNEPEPSESMAREETERETSPTIDASAAAESQPDGPSSSWPAASFGVAALAGYATVPSGALRAALEGELRLGDKNAAWLSSLSFAYARGDHSLAPSDLGMTLLTLELAACPPSFVAEPSVWISACASVRGGRVWLSHSSRDAGAEQNDSWRPWLAVGPSLRVGIPLSERWALRGLAQLAVQLVRDTYFVRLSTPDDPDAQRVPLYRPEAVSLEIGAGIGYAF